MSDTKYLRPRHNVWYFQKRVPKALASLYPNKIMFDESLETGDIKEARIRRDIFLGKLRQQEHELAHTSPEKQSFLKYMEELKSSKAQEIVGGTPESPVLWEDVCDPITQSKENDSAYVEAYYAVLNDKTEVPKYGMTLKELLKRFIQHSEQEDLHTSGTRDRYKKTVDLFVMFNNVKDLPLKELTRDQATAFISHYRQKNLSGATVYGHISRLKTLIEFAYSHSWFTSNNPFDKHKINTIKGRQYKQPFTPEESKKLINLIKHEPPAIRLLVWLGLYTGARISELVSIPLSAINEEDGIVMLGIATEKKGKTKAATRRVPVPDRCLKLFHKVKEASKSAESHYLFKDLVSVRPDGRFGYHATKVISDIKRKHITKRSDKGFHSFRVMMSTALQRVDVSELVSARLVGHKTGATMTYGYYSIGYTAKRLAEEQAKAVLELDNYVGQEIDLN